MMFGSSEGASAPISEVLSIIEQSEKEAFEYTDEDSATNQAERKSAPESFVDLNDVYAEYVSDPTNQFVLGKMLKAVAKYAAGIVPKVTDDLVGQLNNGSKFESPSEVSQDCAFKVWMKLSDPNAKGRFDGSGKFSGWVYKICRHVILDEIRNLKRHAKRETTIPDDETSATLGAPHSGRKGGAEGFIATEDVRSAGTSPEGTDHIGSGAPIPSREFIEGEEDGINANLDFERVFAKLTKREQRIVELYRVGEQPTAIGKEFQRDAKWASNQLTRLKELLKHEMCVAETIFHSCKLPVLGTAQPVAGQLYVEDGGLYRQLPMCRCRKRLTELEAKTLIRNSDAQPVFKVVGGEPIECVGEIWAAQAVRVPRCGLNNTKAHLERAYLDGNRQSQLDIEIGHQLTMRFRQQLIRMVPAEGYDRTEREQSGRVCFTNFKEERDNPTVHPWTPPEPKPIPTHRQTVVIDESAECPNCHKKQMVVSQYADGSIKFDHGACYLIVVSPEKASENPNAVVVMPPSGLTWVTESGTKCPHGVYVPSNTGEQCTTCQFQKVGSKPPQSSRLMCEGTPSPLAACEAAAD